MTLVLSLQLFSTLYMVGVIWFVQIVHYPLLAQVTPSVFTRYEQSNVRHTGWVVTPVMLIEATTSVLLVWLRPPHLSMLLAWGGLGLLTLIWASTFYLQVPQHQKLLGGFDAKAHRRLVRSNWIRTLAWSARGVIVLVMAAMTEGCGP